MDIIKKYQNTKNNTSHQIKKVLEEIKYMNMTNFLIVFYVITNILNFLKLKHIGMIVIKVVGLDPISSM